MAQSQQVQNHNSQGLIEIREQIKWKQPPDLWLKCNIGITWAKDISVAGGAWLLRDSRGEVLLHSRRAFAHVVSMQEAQLTVVIWTMKSMQNHIINQQYYLWSRSK